MVTLTILNAITQPVAYPVVQGDGRQLNKLQLTCGRYTAYWDGYLIGRRQKAPSGTYPYVLQVDGHKFQAKMTVAK